MMKFSRVIANDRSDVHTKGQGQILKVKVTEVKTQFSHFRTETPVWIHFWWWNDGQSLMLLRRGVLLFFQVHPSNFKGTRLKKSSVLTQLWRFRTLTPVWIHPLLWNDAQSLMEHRRCALLFFKVICQISRSYRTRNRRFCPNWAFPDSNSSLNSLIALKWCTKLDAV